uniref:NADH dehydrogenase subunit 6 n=1 Tax=Spastonyx nemognathoides TaxID=2908340 RepID=UPI001EE10561|nr:NADH dehydrogenase subunit 6 [Spastonyx nemognathoides]UKE80222.1 NADH dehydrogenase subunit 6 [Spastonyx nemognathoides]
MTLLMMNLTFSAIFLTLSHPLSLGLVLLIQTTTISLMTGAMCINFWFSYILFLIMVGGMLILFIYMTSIASNEKFSFSPKTSSPTLIAFLCILMPTAMTFMSDNPTSNSMTTFLPKDLAISMIKYTSMPMSILLVFMMIYLFITLIATVKIIDTKSGPLRPKT